jgi:hypothetical protein
MICLRINAISIWCQMQRYVIAYYSLLDLPDSIVTFAWIVMELEGPRQVRLIWAPHCCDYKIRVLSIEVQIVQPNTHENLILIIQSLDKRTLRSLDPVKLARVRFKSCQDSVLIVIKMSRVGERVLHQGGCCHSERPFQMKILVLHFHMSLSWPIILHLN